MIKEQKGKVVTARCKTETDPPHSSVWESDVTCTACLSR